MEELINTINEDMDIDDIEDIIFREDDIDEDDSQLSLTHYLELCLKFEEDPTDNNLLEISSFFSKMQIRDFLPLKDKTFIAITIAKDLVDELDASGAASTLEINKLFKGLLAYVVNLKNDIGFLDKTFVAYDYCYIHGLVDEILGVCAKDYQRLCSYIDNMINVSNAYRLIQTASVLNDTEYTKWVDTLKDLKEKITPEMLKSLLAVDTMSHGGGQLQAVLGEAAAKEAMSGLEEDELKYKSIGKDLGKKLSHIQVGKEETKEE